MGRKQKQAPEKEGCSQEEEGCNLNFPLHDLTIQALSEFPFIDTDERGDEKSLVRSTTFLRFIDFSFLGNSGGGKNKEREK
jgi:hypothetical protein